MALLLRALLTERFDGRQCRFHAQRLEPVQHFLGKHMVDAHSAKGDASRRRELVEGAHALVTISLAVADVKLLAAPGAAEQAGQQSFAGADRASAHEPLAVGVIGDQLLIPFVLGPGNIALVVVADQNLPAAPVALHAPDHPLAPVLDRHARGSAAEGVGAGIDGVGQHVMNCRINRQAPDNPAGRTAAQGRQQNLFLPAPHQHLADRLKLGELAEHQRDGLLDTSICILLDTVSASLHIADRHGEEEFARRAFCFIASVERCRKTESSISLIVPFMPSRSRSLGEAES